MKTFPLKLNETEDTKLRSVADRFFAGNRTAAIKNLLNMVDEGGSYKLLENGTYKIYSVVITELV